MKEIKIYNVILYFNTSDNHDGKLAMLPSQASS